MRKWTESQEKAVIKAAKKNPDNLRLAFRALAKQINRTPDAIVTRYYDKLQNQ